MTTISINRQVKEIVISERDILITYGSPIESPNVESPNVESPNVESPTAESPNVESPKPEVTEQPTVQKRVLHKRGYPSKEDVCSILKEARDQVVFLELLHKSQDPTLDTPVRFLETAEKLYKNVLLLRSIEREKVGYEGFARPYNSHRIQ